ncbi:MAG: M20/M25/M40 family metallo-hydrolase [Bacteroidales bacterium]|nr:M20/M25/M40 family metallo-hydrolase [Bacteroidales bacterium]
MTDLLQQLIALPSPSREEGAVADFLESRLRQYGLAPKRSGNNLWCVKGSGPAVLVDAHTDTVKPAPGWRRDPFRPVLEDGKLYGLGANDDGGSLVALIHFFLQAEPRKHTLVLSLSAEEEVSGHGGLEQALPLMEADAGPFCCGIIGEPTGMQLAVSERGLLVLDCESAGIAGHAARADGINALYEALPDIAWFRENGMQVTQIEAGTQHNVIPDRCRFVVDVRTVRDNTAVLARIQEHVKCRVTPRSTRLHGSTIAPSHPLVKAARSLGIPAFDSPTLSNQALCRFPTVKLGPGESARSHSADEYILLREVEEAVPLYLKFWQAYENLG